MATAFIYMKSFLVSKPLILKDKQGNPQALVSPKRCCTSLYRLKNQNESVCMGAVVVKKEEKRIEIAENIKILLKCSSKIEIRET